MIARAEFVSYVRSLKGTPFHHQGRLPGIGLDCPGPLICACWHFGIKPRSFDVNGYPMMPDGKTLKALCDAHMIEIEPEDLQTADVVLVRWQKGPPQHLGITVDYPGGRLAMVHAASVGRAGVVETRLEFGRAMGLVACYAVPGVG